MLVEISCRKKRKFMFLSPNAAYRYGVGIAVFVKRQKLAILFLRRRPRGGWEIRRKKVLRCRS